MSPGTHLGASLAAGIGAYAALGSWQTGAGALIAGVVLDLDHLADYALNPLGRFRVRKFLQVCNQYRLKRFYLFAHSLEWIIPFLFLVWAWPAPDFLVGAAAGLALHMGMDMAGNGMRIQAYFLLYRLYHGFDPRKMLFRLPSGGLAYWGSFAAFMRGRPEGPEVRKRPGTARRRSGMM